MRNLDAEREIRRILHEGLRVEVPDVRTDLLETGLVDSLGFVDLVASIESTFGIVVSLVDIDLDEFRTIESITRFVVRQLEPPVEPTAAATGGAPVERPGAPPTGGPPSAAAAGVPPRPVVAEAG